MDFHKLISRSVSKFAIKCVTHNRGNPVFIGLLINFNSRFLLSWFCRYQATPTPAVCVQLVLGIDTSVIRLLIGLDLGHGGYM